MKKFLVGLFISLSAIFLFAFASYNFSRNALLSQKIKNTNETEIIVHFTHGSVTQKGCSDKRSSLGGKWGGHVAIEIDGFIYGFGRRKNPVHIFPSKNYNAIFTKESRKNWEGYSVNDKITDIILPITNEQKYNLKNLCEQYCDNTPYDYATFGKRCTYSAYSLLVSSKIFKPQSELSIHSITAYPALFRKIFVEWAQENNLKIVRKEGIACREWE